MFSQILIQYSFENDGKCHFFGIHTFITTSRKYFNWLVTRPGLSALGINGGNTWPLMGSRAGSSPSSALGEPKFKDIFHLFLFLIFLKRLLFVNIDRRQVYLYLADSFQKTPKLSLRISRIIW